MGVGSDASSSGGEVPGQPIAQRWRRQSWAYPRQRKNAAELRERLPEWEVRGREVETAWGQALDEGARICALDQ
eukprot:5063584-Alexandrium_andersonii.AAC.1